MSNASGPSVSEGTIHSTTIRTHLTVSGNITHTTEARTPRHETVHPTTRRTVPTTNATTSHVPATTEALTTAVCLNGGDFNGTSCVCRAQFEGPRCQYSESSFNITGEVTLTASFQLKIYNLNYSKDFSNTSSEAYNALSIKFMAEIRAILKNVTEFKGFSNIVFTSGSVDVSYLALIALPIGPRQVLSHNLSTTVSDMVSKLQATYQSTNKCGEEDHGLYCFSNSSIRATPGKIDYADFCHAHAPPGFSEFYFPDNTDSVFRCVSVCVPGAPGELNCHYGDCKLLNTGPECVCRDTRHFWYFGKDCQTRISRPGVIGGVSALLAVLLILLVIILVVIPLRRCGKVEISSRNLIDTDYTDSITGPQWYIPRDE
ncbi:mucin-3A-like [Anomaloglossus baeobatrachus]|uniref:mucin-3A-like n=1 Tax=Anomaloglossus baeobatrachus TaxID=238106 RepID=UPI003F503D2B